MSFISWDMIKKICKNWHLFLPQCSIRKTVFFSHTTLLVLGFVCKAFKDALVITHLGVWNVFSTFKPYGGNRRHNHSREAPNLTHECCRWAGGGIYCQFLSFWHDPIMDVNPPSQGRHSTTRLVNCFVLDDILLNVCLATNEKKQSWKKKKRFLYIQSTENN